MTSSTGQQAAANLRALREQWGDLLTAIGQRPAAVWPPRRTQDRAVDEEMAGREPTVGRLPLTLREHPAPVNLDALDEALHIERAVFGACDAVAKHVQRPVRYWIGLRGSLTRDDADHNDPNRWHRPARTAAALTAHPTRILTATDPRTDKDRQRRAERLARLAEHGQPTEHAERHAQAVDGFPAAAAGSRAYGLHWAAVWLEGRALGEPAGPDGDLFAPTPGPVVESIAEVAVTALRRLEGALHRDARPTDIGPCPYCGGTLTARMRSGDPETAVITCDRGAACGAPVVVERGRRTWRGADLTTLWVALEARRSAVA
jgi:hypothetical protein